MHDLRRLWLSIWIAALYAITVLVIPFVHRAPGPMAPSGPQVQLFALPDGSLPTLCLTAAADGKHDPSSWSCPACTLAALAGLVLPPLFLAEPPLAPRAVNATRPPRLFASAPVSPAARPRAPPRLA